MELLPEVDFLPFYNEAKVDLVLIQAFLLYYVNHVAVMLTGIFY